MPTRSRRSDESQALQHLSTPLRDWLKTIGLFSEIIAGKTLFLSQEAPAILEGLTLRHRLLELSSPD
ncbi:hypothetical protein QD357_26530 [Rhizobium sp. BR 317]|uniref:hypothetical protein n=1 Tax=Rhizobium sp. BR 317 TaxID=3040015 RepID=UPI0039BFC18E